MKQAVVLIHGIGEQVPMDTLRGFVRAVWTTDENVRNGWNPDQVWSKPDSASKNYELRRLTTAKGTNGMRTDFFEFYWADLMEGTEVKHLAAWLKLLLLRSPVKVPSQLMLLWFTVAILTILIPLFFILWKFEVISIPGLWVSVIGGLATVVWAAASGFLINFVGDAARYLHVAPPNIGRRRAIREAGIDLLTRLHENEEYVRIIVVGHSLGSVIGYDLLTHLWPKYNTGHTPMLPGGQPDPLEVLSVKEGLTAKEYQEEQSNYAKRLRQGGNQWKITDFITVGSPLAHASFLLTRKPEEFQTKKTERELPTCPPVPEKIDGMSRFSYKVGNNWTPHHAAVFGPTRWTNLYFPCTLIVRGDVVGGRVGPMFGAGVKDVPLITSNRFLAHTHYWSLPDSWEKGDEVPGHIAALREAVRLAEDYEA